MYAQKCKVKCIKVKYKIDATNLGLNLTRIIKSLY